MRALVAMSGGVDSSVAAALMLETGYDVVGVTLKQWEGEDGAMPVTGCCTVSDAEDARSAARVLGIPYYVLDHVEEFTREVVDRFGHEYLADHGLVLGENGKLYDSKKQERLPDGVKPMPLMSDADLAKRGEPTTAQVLPNHVARYLDLVALADRKPVTVIGETGVLRDRPGFEVDFMTRASARDSKQTAPYPTVLMPVHGHWKVTWDGGSATLAPGDTMSVPENLGYTVTPSMTGEASLYRIVATEDPAGPTWQG